MGSALARFGYVDLDLEVDQEARTLVPPSMPGEEPRESDRPSVAPMSCTQSVRPMASDAPSASGITRRRDDGDRASAMRDLYERGEVEEALALGASLASLFENGEAIPERIGVEDDEDDVSPFAGLRELQAPLSAAIAELDDGADDAVD